MDIVERLRNDCSCNIDSTPCGAEEQCRNAYEAANEIERLQGEVMAWWKEAELMRGDLSHYSAALNFIAMAKPLNGQTWEDHAKEMTDYAIKALERRGLPND